MKWEEYVEKELWEDEHYLWRGRWRQLHCMTSEDVGLVLREEGFEGATSWVWEEDFEKIGDEESEREAGEEDESERIVGREV